MTDTKEIGTVNIDVNYYDRLKSIEATHKEDKKKFEADAEKAKQDYDTAKTEMFNICGNFARNLSQSGIEEITIHHAMTKTGYTLILNSRGMDTKIGSGSKIINLTMK
jgi:hypothetical protein